MAHTLPSETRLELDQLKEEVESIKALIAKRSTLPLPAWLSTIFQGVTLTILVAAAFWFGSLGSAVARTEAAVDELRKSVQELQKGSVETNGRLNAIEVEMRTRLKVLEDSQAETNSRLQGVESRLTTVETRLTNIESRLTNVEKKLGP